MSLFVGALFYIKTDTHAHKSAHILADKRQAFNEPFTDEMEQLVYSGRLLQITMLRRRRRRRRRPDWEIIVER